MTETQRRAAIQALLKKHTAEKTVTAKIARDSLIKEGIYRKDGKLRAEYGGGEKRGKSAA